MRILANENFPALAITALHSRGHDVVCIRTDAFVALALRGEGHDVVRVSEVGQSRADDEQILEKAIAENRILVTLDEHFGDWVILPLRSHPGVIRLKVNPTTSRNIIDLLSSFLMLHTPEQLKNHLVILSPKRSKWVRQHNCLCAPPHLTTNIPKSYSEFITTIKFP